MVPVATTALLPPTVGSHLGSMGGGRYDRAVCTTPHPFDTRCIGRYRVSTRCPFFCL